LNIISANSRFGCEDEDIVTVLNKACDVLVSHAAGDARLAKNVADALRANGLEAVTDAELLDKGTEASDALWEALSESRALVTILPPTGPTPSMTLELGAARAWNKPVFGVVTDPSTAHVPPWLRGVHVYTSGQIDDIIRAIKQSGQELSEDDRSLLADLYRAVGIPVDQFALDPTELDRFVQRFRAAAGRTVSGERLLSELLRMRKQGKLSRIPASRSRTRRDTA
jgi:hypothetical protein